MITLQNVTLRRGPHVLLKDVNWTIYHKQRIGVIGANGAGKSSLFSLILKELEVDTGNIELPKQLRMAHVAQETPGYSRSALDFVLDGDTELRTLEEELVQAEQDDDGNRIAALHARMGEIDAYTANSRAAKLLDGLGFDYHQQRQSVSDFSGGWRVRLNLAKALMCRSDILLLDEPTNHLDLDAVLWLENWLIKYPGTLLLISHDREFLDHVVDHILHVHNQQLTMYTGNYSLFEKQRAEKLLLQQSAFEKQQKHIKHLQSFVDRFGAKASKAKQAQSRVKAIAKMELVSAVQIDSTFEFHFKEPLKCPNPLVHLDDASVAYDGRVVLSDLSFSITPKDRIALLGPNGAGKSSLIKLLAGEVPSATGVRSVGEGLKIGYFDQHQVDCLELEETPLYHLRELAPPSIREQQLRTFLGTFGFTGQRVLEKVKVFSGGEKSRLALGLLVWQQPNLLLLDEPTNHLDLDTRHTLSMALQEYEGAMILVSHDRFLVSTTVDQLMLVANGRLNPFEGDLDEYQRWLLDFRRQNDNSSPSPVDKSESSRKAQRQLDAKQREMRRPLVAKVKKLEEALEKLQKEANQLEIILTDTALYDEDKAEKLNGYLAQQTELNKRLKTVENEWLTACAELEEL